MPSARLRHTKDPDAMVAQLLRQFKSSKSRTTTPTPTRQSQVDTDNVASHRRAGFAINVPSIDNPEDYAFLPGHFGIDRVLEVRSDEPQGPTYTVKLQSGELETMSYSQLSKLEYGLESLADFKERPEFIDASESSEDEIQVVGGRHQMPPPLHLPMAHHLRRYLKWNRPDHPALVVCGFGPAQLQKEAGTLGSFTL